MPWIGECSFIRTRTLACTLRCSTFQFGLRLPDRTATLSAVPIARMKFYYVEQIDVP